VSASPSSWSGGLTPCTKERGAGLPILLLEWRYVTAGAGGDRGAAKGRQDNIDRLMMAHFQSASITGEVTKMSHEKMGAVN